MRQLLRTVLTGCLGLAAMCGCTHYHHLDSMTAEETAFFEKRAETSAFEVVMADSSIAAGTHLATASDSIAWTNPESGDTVLVAAGAVNAIDRPQVTPPLVVPGPAPAD